jgi:hypothetical protein
MAILEPLSKEQHEPLRLPQLGSSVASSRAGQSSPCKGYAVAVVVGDQGHASMNAAADEPYRACGLTVDDIERALALQAHERLVGAREPGRISPGQPRMVVRSIHVVPPHIVLFFLANAPRVAGRDDLDFLAGRREPFGKRARVILHPADGVARDRHDADPHGRSILAGHSLNGRRAISG